MKTARYGLHFISVHSIQLCRFAHSFTIQLTPALVYIYVHVIHRV